MACNQLKYVGKVVVLEYAIACPDVMPAAGDWKRIGAMTGKNMSIEWDTADTTADDSVGSLRENLATFQSLTISGDGMLKAGDNVDALNLKELNKHIVQPTATGGQPFVWLRMTYPDLTFIAPMLMSTFERDAPFDGPATYSLEASATASPYGLLVEDTPEPVAPTTVTVTPGTASVAVGATTQLAVTVAPTGAPQAVIWTSSAPSIAAVDSDGTVTGVAAGSATITARSAVDTSKTGTSTITVTTP
ncbi:Ig domain-containing protein [Streptococcus salivarius]|uniref:Ig domain-containing protein n=1 Tax=Streptococcus salivarius TaxID=1304 RepID=A0AAX2UZY0_STRSL|nr:phage tail protein [Streptococcus salivarius]TNF65769.1 Ig domain-containing protein [Streptococcus salivarius]